MILLVCILIRLNLLLNKRHMKLGDAGGAGALGLEYYDEFITLVTQVRIFTKFSES